MTFVKQINQMNATLSWSNNSSVPTETTEDGSAFVTYYPLFLIVAGTIFNILTFIILCRPVFRDAIKQSTLHYMRTIAIFDILMLYGWNFDHYLYGVYGFTLQAYSVPFCKVCSFLNYFAAQVSAWLRVFICIERCLALNRPYNIWLGQSRNVLIIIIGIVAVFVIVNCHFFLFACYYNEDGTVNPTTRLYVIYPLWDYINLGIYNCVPFIFMVAFNSSVIYRLMQLRQPGAIQNTRVQHRSISITLVIITFLFLIMTIPATICFAFFSSKVSYFVLHLFDCVLYTYHILSFPIYLITFRDFRQETFRLMTPNRWHRTQPLPLAKTITNRRDK